MRGHDTNIRRRRTARRGFSLIEVMLVSAILVILSALAFINVVYVMDQQRRKATIAEARQIASAVTFARQNTGFYVKLNYLLEPLTPYLDASGDGIVDPGPNGVIEANDDLYADLEYNSFDLTANDAYQRRIKETWDGPYFALSPTARDSMRGPTGYIEVEMPERSPSPPPYVKRRWPTDQYGNPYVLYLLELADPREGQPDPNDDYHWVGNVRFLKIPTAEPSFAAAVVSYGEDELPGTQRDPANLDELQRKRTQRLFLKQGDYTFRMRVREDLRYEPGVNDEARMRVEGYSEQRFKDVSGYTWSGSGRIGVNDLVGVTDIVDATVDGVNQRIASDDIVIEF